MRHTASLGPIERVTHNLLARAPRLAPGKPSTTRADSADPVARVKAILRDGRVHTTREIIDPLPDSDARCRALAALKRMHRQGMIAKTGFGNWQASARVANAA
ncbi:hypothetical protein CKO28_06190 [Rhodovibrio sodomensis]|uniref:Uncharacterized protein n=1 Tax=Rhodovibrio sodomensis TaxID=1088 RepID=A0ABS1DBV9_9PROT|nr:hypothetical protein [Rhodovibrio sodomensis]MBK1667622.1 hypothetical protein [Rhodovibrio sodomensis]